MSTATAQVAAALDFGGTKLAFGIVSEAGTILWRSEAPTEQRSASDVAAWAAEQWRETKRVAGSACNAVRALGATVPGPVDPAKRALVRAPAHGLADVPFADILSDALGLPTTIENDVNACALAEQEFGHAAANLLWVTVSTGIGGALLLNGALYEGRGFAGEIGHFVVEEDGPLCGCGHRGCLEAVASGRALARAACEAGLGEIDARGLFDLLPSEPRARAIVEAATFALGRALAFAVNLVDPASIVVGGGVGTHVNLPTLREHVNARILASGDRTPQIVHTALGTDAALLGAGVVALARLGHA